MIYCHKILIISILPPFFCISSDPEAVDVCLDGEHLCYATLDNSHGDINEVTIELPDEYYMSDAQGTYTFTIKENMIGDGEFNFETFLNDLVEGTGNEAVTLTYTVAGPGVGVDPVDAGAFSIVAAKDCVTVKGHSGALIELYDMGGCRLHSAEDILNISGLAAGAYIVKATAGKDTVIKKIIVR